VHNKHIIKKEGSAEGLQQMKPIKLIDIAQQCRGIVLRARRALGEDLGGCSMLDLVADNITHVSLDDLRAALVIAGVGYRGGRE
jgi:hypothetical protein